MKKHLYFLFFSFISISIISCSNDDSSDNTNTNSDTDTPTSVINTNDPNFDLSVDPGINPVFLNDPELNQTEDYTYVETSPGDHNLPDGIIPIAYDVSGVNNLQTTLSNSLADLENGHGLALYLKNGNELNDQDLSFLQRLNLNENGWPGLDNLNTLHVYNLLRLQPGIESTTETAFGIPEPFLWKNGWQGPESIVLQGEGGWVDHIVMDDLEEISAGAFCDTNFSSMSFKGAKIVRQMGLGFAPRAPATILYMPSVEMVEQHAFRRRQRILKYNFPKLKEVGSFAFDDNSRMQYINLPSLETTDIRNSFNDPRDLIAFNFPKVEYLGLSCMGGTNDTTTIFRFPAMLNFDGSSLRGHSNMEFIWAPEATRIGPNVFIGNSSLTTVYMPKVEDVGRFAFQDCTSLVSLELQSATIIRINAFDGATALEEVRLPSIQEIQNEVFLNVSSLERVYLGDTPPEQGTNAFTGTSPNLTIFYTGNNPEWETWRPVGNETAQVIREE